jgi:hypothetical protein
MYEPQGGGGWSWCYTRGGGAGVVPSGVGVGVATTEGQYGVNVIPGGGGLQCSSTNRIN